MGNRPVKLRRSTWEERDIKVVRQKDKERKKEMKKITRALVATQDVGLGQEGEDEE